MADLLTVAEAASFLRVSERTIRRMCAEGDLPAIRVRTAWRIRRVDLAELLEPAT